MWKSHKRYCVNYIQTCFFLFLTRSLVLIYIGVNVQCEFQVLWLSSVVIYYKVKESLTQIRIIFNFEWKYVRNLKNLRRSVTQSKIDKLVRNMDKNVIGTTPAHFCSKLKIDIFCSNNFQLLFLKKWFSDFVYNFSDCMTDSFLMELRVLYFSSCKFFKRIKENFFLILFFFLVLSHFLRFFFNIFSIFQVFFFKFFLNFPQTFLNFP